MVPIMIGGSSSRKFILAVTVGMDVMYLSIIYFQKFAGGNLKKLRTDVLTDGVIGCLQRKEWMGFRTMNFWYECVFKAYVSGYMERSGLLMMVSYIIEALICRRK